MKATIEFDLNDLDDQMAHKRSVMAFDMAMAVWEIVHNSKKRMHNVIEAAMEEDKNITPHDAIDIVYDNIYKTLDDRGIRIDDLIN